MKKYLIFTDLDGTLLDHENYSYGNNKKTITSISTIFSNSSGYTVANTNLNKGE